MVTGLQANDLINEGKGVRTRDSIFLKSRVAIWYCLALYYCGCASARISWLFQCFCFFQKRIAQSWALSGPKHTPGPGRCFLVNFLLPPAVEDPFVLWNCCFYALPRSPHKRRIRRNFSKVLSMLCSVLDGQDAACEEKAKRSKTGLGGISLMGRKMRASKCPTCMAHV